jgi:hypothetical protein
MCSLHPNGLIVRFLLVLRTISPYSSLLLLLLPPLPQYKHIGGMYGCGPYTCGDSLHVPTRWVGHLETSNTGGTGVNVMDHN